MREREKGGEARGHRKREDARTGLSGYREGWRLFETVREEGVCPQGGISTVRVVAVRRETREKARAGRSQLGA